MWNVPNKNRLSKIPKLYETDGIPILEKNIYLHFFIGGCDWYITEYDGEDTFFGYVILNGDLQNAEFGYISFQELKDIKVSFMEIDCELAKYWKPQKIKDIKNLEHLKQTA